MAFELETERLTLRDVRAADFETLLAQAREPEARRGILAYQAEEFYNRQALLKAIKEAQFARRENYTLTVVRQSDRAIIGCCSAADVRRDSIETVLGWHYGKDFWGRGYATEAGRALLYIGFEIGGVREIYADCFADNLASRRVMEKIGMQTRPNLELFDQLRGLSYGERRPTVRYIITKTNYELRMTNDRFSP
jgi:RimJ/RimL family protein N-acetyltransferase